MTHYTALNVYDENLNYLLHFCHMRCWITWQFSWVHRNVEEFLCKVVISKPLQIKSLKNLDLTLEAVFIFHVLKSVFWNKLTLPFPQSCFISLKFIFCNPIINVGLGRIFLFCEQTWTFYKKGCWVSILLRLHFK